MKEGLRAIGRRLLARDSGFLSLSAGKLRWKGMTLIINVQWVWYIILCSETDYEPGEDI